VTAGLIGVFLENTGKSYYKCCFINRGQDYEWYHGGKNQGNGSWKGALGFLFFFIFYLISYWSLSTMIDV